MSFWPHVTKCRPLPHTHIREEYAAKWLEQLFVCATRNVIQRKHFLACISNTFGAFSKDFFCFPTFHQVQLLVDELHDAYPDKCSRNVQWVLNYSGGIFCPIMFMHARSVRSAASPSFFSRPVCLQTSKTLSFVFALLSQCSSILKSIPSWVVLKNNFCEKLFLL